MSFWAVVAFVCLLEAGTSADEAAEALARANHAHGLDPLREHGHLGLAPHPTARGEYMEVAKADLALLVVVLHAAVHLIPKLLEGSLATQLAEHDEMAKRCVMEA